ncbi:MAG TPA: hypothetical protein H9889_05045 [Candidatus Ignatzschineria merdigallinarum]|uniref:Uncharacterized protein n=1 Tax=Candidatus Ignatzschineria merdigallinarum TaxID=2838621 RepID=A0A9D1Q5Y0_9GAMM|nr:hypothetical protein [Candidatus Ignatzschineria merdigallinarum]
MTKSAKTPSKTAIFIISWIGLFIFNFLFARTTSTVPVPVIALFMLFTAGALYKERIQLRSFSIISFIIAVLFIAIAYFGTIWLRYEVYNLFDIRGPKFFQITFYLLMFLNAAAFTTVAMGLFKAISTTKNMIITWLLTAIIYFTISYLLRDFLTVLAQITEQMLPG